MRTTGGPETFNGYRMRTWQGADGRSVYAMHDEAGVCRCQRDSMTLAIAWAHAQQHGGWIIRTDNLQIHEAFAAEQQASDDATLRRPD